MKKPVVFTLIAVTLVVALTSFMSLSTTIKGISAIRKKPLLHQPTYRHLPNRFTISP
jgi:hypothetical protein